MTERQIADGICAYLRKEGLLFIRARMDKKSTIAEGWPDITVVHAGKAWLCEVKTPTGKLSKKQFEVIGKLRGNGNKVCIVINVEMGIDAVQAWSGIMSHPGNKNALQAAEGAQKRKAWNECDHEWDTCTGPPHDSRLGKQICNYCGVEKDEYLKEADVNADDESTQKGSQAGSVAREWWISGNDDGVGVVGFPYADKSLLPNGIRVREILSGDILTSSQGGLQPKNKAGIAAQSLSEQEKAPSVGAGGGSDAAEASSNELFISMFMGIPTVFQRDKDGYHKLLRTATQYDLLHLKA